ncbi:MAG: phosphatidylserine/phosphatidylglycerophosphate/cardiolipin synthase family protein [bacterium]|nr:phosphatidylserine/phosphatidylglycerophosphate/cardiolipin synthase family protein [bacterium]
MNTTMSPQAAYHQLGTLLADVPDLLGFDRDYKLPTTTIQWLAKATALVNAATGISPYRVRMDYAVQNLVATLDAERHAREIILVLNQVLATLEIELPASAQGAFVTTGASLDAYAAISKIVGQATKSVLIIDPYMDATAVIEVAGLASAGVDVQLLSDAKSVKPTLKPAADKWVQQYGPTRPLEVRLAAAGSLHDRLIMTDSMDAWVLTQSLKDFAKRSPATIQRADAELAVMKVQAFNAIWNGAVRVV